MDPGGSKIQHITFYDLFAKKGIGKRLFPSLVGNRGVESYMYMYDLHTCTCMCQCMYESYMYVALQSWLEQDSTSGGIPWWIDENEAEAGACRQGDSGCA